MTSTHIVHGPKVADLIPANEVNATGPMALPDAKAVWLADAADAIDRLAHRGRAFTADDLRAMIGEPEHGNWVGTAFARARNAGSIKAIASGAALAKTRNGGRLQIWTANV